MRQEKVGASTRTTSEGNSMTDDATDDVTDNEIVITIHLHRDNETVSVVVTDPETGDSRTEDYSDEHTVMTIYTIMAMLMDAMEKART